MNPLTDPELRARREGIQLSDNSFALTGVLANLLVDIAGQASSQQANLATLTTTLGDSGVVKLSPNDIAQIGTLASGHLDALTTALGDSGAVKLSLDNIAQIGTLASGHLDALTMAFGDSGAVKLSLDAINTVAAQTRNHLSHLVTELGYAKGEIGAVKTSLDNIAQIGIVANDHLHGLTLRGSEERPLHVHMHGVPQHMIVELQPAALETLVKLLEELRDAMKSLVTISQSEQRFAVLERRIAECETRGAQRKRS